MKIGINGFGRIGRGVVRSFLKNKEKFKDIEIVAINDLSNLPQLSLMLAFDSVHGQLTEDVTHTETHIFVGNKMKLRKFSEKDPSKIDWTSEGVDLVIDSTGIFKTKEDLGKHIQGSVKKVIMSAPVSNLDATFVMGVNDDQYNKNKHHIVSNASCTTNCLAPIMKVLEDNFGVVKGSMTTIHSYTADQRLVDSHHSDSRRARAANLSMIPTTTGAAKAVSEVIPSLKGKLDGVSIRVPTPNVSLTDVTVVLKKETTKEELNKLFKNVSKTSLKNILGTEERPLVSCDFNGNSLSSIIDTDLTYVDGNYVKIFSWYDNETGYSTRLLDLARVMV